MNNTHVHPYVSPTNLLFVWIGENPDFGLYQSIAVNHRIKYYVGVLNIIYKIKVLLKKLS